MSCAPLQPLFVWSFIHYAPINLNPDSDGVLRVHSMRYACEQLGIPLEAEEALVDLYNSLRHQKSSFVSRLVKRSDDYCTRIHDAGEDVTPSQPSLSRLS